MEPILETCFFAGESTASLLSPLLIDTPESPSLSFRVKLLDLLRDNRLDFLGELLGVLAWLESQDVDPLDDFVLNNCTESFAFEKLIPMFSVEPFSAAIGAGVSMAGVVGISAANLSPCIRPEQVLSMRSKNMGLLIPLIILAT